MSDQMRMMGIVILRSVVIITAVARYPESCVRLDEGEDRYPAHTDRVDI